LSDVEIWIAPKVVAVDRHRGVTHIPTLATTTTIFWINWKAAARIECLDGNDRLNFECHVAALKPR
jgi:hypothetical protein